MALEAFRHIRSKVSEYEWFNKEIHPHPQSKEDPLALDVRVPSHITVLEITAGWPSTGYTRYPVTVELTDDTPPSRRLPSQAKLIAAIEKVPLPGRAKANVHIYFLDVTLLYDEKPESPILLDLFKGIRQLHWHGHRDQLCKSWIPISPMVFPSLYVLELHCGVSLQDCAHILFHFKSLRRLKIESIFKQLSRDARLPFNLRSTHIDRPNLHTLLLWSDDDIGPLFVQFTFPSLQNLTLYLEYPTIGTFDSLEIWTNIQYGTLACFTTKEDGEWIRNLLPPGSQFRTPTPGDTGYIPGVAWSDEEDAEDFVVF